LVGKGRANAWEDAPGVQLEQQTPSEGLGLGTLIKGFQRDRITRDGQVLGGSDPDFLLPLVLGLSLGLHISVGALSTLQVRTKKEKKR
jgi:hypothetical protein